MNQNIPKQNNGINKLPVNSPAPNQHTAMPKPPAPAAGQNIPKPAPRPLAGQTTTAPNKTPAGQNLGTMKNTQPKPPIPPAIPKPAVKVNNPAAINKQASAVKTNPSATAPKQANPAKPSTQIKLQNTTKNNGSTRTQKSKNNQKTNNDEERPKNTGFFSSKLNIIMSISSIIIIIAVIFMLMFRSDGVSKDVIIIKCTHCNEKFEVDRKEAKGKDYLTCTKCNQIVVLNEEKLKDEAVNLYVKASDLVRQSYKESDPDKAEAMREEASVHLEKALEIFRIIPEQQRSATYDNIMLLKKEIRSRRTHHQE
ncbi:MAG: tetratricopeptide repeat protein [Planctomycetes bacterium]|nr:tetratricopeptide repeat protein [Planctomycetota bacterium]